MMSINSVSDRLSSSPLLRAAAIAGIFLALPFVLSPFTASHVIPLAIIAIGYNLLLGYGGELSFGHAAFYGGGAYLTIKWAEVLPNLYVAVLLGVVTVGIFAIPFAYLSLRRRGLYFAMITLALAQMVYVIVNQATSVTGGSNGLVLPLGPGDAALGPLEVLGNYWVFYGFALVLLAVVYLAVYRITSSPFGRALVAIRESEDRARHLGYPVNKLLLVTFVMSGLLGGLAGALHASLYAFISPSLLFWTMSGEIVIITILGGIGTRGGPVVGAIVFTILSDTLSQMTDIWPLFFGAIFVVIVMLAPQGIFGLYKQYTDDEEDNPGQDIRVVLRRIVTGNVE
jgi:branched-chain amino acid transport system permease protein